MKTAAHSLIRRRRRCRAVVSCEEAEEMARRLGLKFYRSCSKEGLNVNEGAAQRCG